MIDSLGDTCVGVVMVNNVTPKKKCQEIYDRELDGNKHKPFSVNYQ